MIENYNKSTGNRIRLFNLKKGQIYLCSLLIISFIVVSHIIKQRTNQSTEHRFNCCFSSQSNHGVFFNKISRVSEITVIRNVNNEQILDKIHCLLVNTKFYLFDHFQEQDRIFYFLSHKNRSLLIILWFTSSKRHLNQGVDVVVIVGRFTTICAISAYHL